MIIYLIPMLKEHKRWKYSSSDLATNHANSSMHNYYHVTYSALFRTTGCDNHNNTCTFFIIFCLYFIVNREVEYDTKLNYRVIHNKTAWNCEMRNCLTMTVLLIFVIVRLIKNQEKKKTINIGTVNDN